jgi:hypothetical protein
VLLKTIQPVRGPELVQSYFGLESHSRAKYTSDKLRFC